MNTLRYEYVAQQARRMDRIRAWGWGFFMGAAFGIILGRFLN